MSDPAALAGGALAPYRIPLTTLGDANGLPNTRLDAETMTGSNWSFGVVGATGADNLVGPRITALVDEQTAIAKLSFPIPTNYTPGNIISVEIVVFDYQLGLDSDMVECTLMVSLECIGFDGGADGSWNVRLLHEVVQPITSAQSTPYTFTVTDPDKLAQVLPGGLIQLIISLEGVFVDNNIIPSLGSLTMNFGG